MDCSFCVRFSDVWVRVFVHFCLFVTCLSNFIKKMARRTVVDFDPVNRKYYRVVEPNTVQYFQKFQSIEHKFGVVFEVPQGVIGYEDQLFIFESILQQIINDLIDQHDIMNRDMVQLIFGHPELRAQFVSVPIIRASDLNAKSVLDLVESLMNSGGVSWFYDGRLLIHLIIIRIPVGGRKNCLNRRPTIFRMEEWLKSLSSVVTLEKNIKLDQEDHLCCARAIVVSLAKANTDPQ